MAEPVLIVHGVANHTSGPFVENVAKLQTELGSAWKLIPVFWGDLGGQSVDITDCLPIHTASGWSVRSEDEALPAPTVRAVVGDGKLSNDDRADIIAGHATRTGDETVRSEAPDPAIAEAVRAALQETQILKHIDNPDILRQVGELIRAATDGGAPSGTDEFAVRGGEEDVRSLLDPIKNAAKLVIHSVDDMLGKFVGDKLGEFNQSFRGAVVGPFALFFGDILVYQRNQEVIQQRLWDKIQEVAPGYGTKDKPINVIAHSLGGVIVFDAAVRPNAQGNTLWMKSFTTFGSQPALFHIIDPRKPRLTPYASNHPVTLPAEIGKWTNLWDTLDILAFTAGTVFRLVDGSTPTDIPVEDPLSLLIEEKGWAHSIYWKTEELLNALNKTLVP